MSTIIKYLNFKPRRTFGVEMEMGQEVTQKQIQDAINYKTSRGSEVFNWHQSEFNSAWHVKYDSTCGTIKDPGNGKFPGWEVASFVASKYEDLEEIGSVAEAISSIGAKVNNNCGFHIHVNIKDFNATQINNLLAIWLKIEPMFYFATPQHRLKSKYCMPLRSKITQASMLNPTTIWEKFQPTHFGPHDNPDKKFSINTVNYAKHVNFKNNSNRPTIELRMPEGTLNKEDIINWTRLFVYFVQSNKHSPCPTDINTVSLLETLHFLNLESINNDVFYILSSGLRQTKLWFLRRIIYYSNNEMLINQAKEICNRCINISCKENKDVIDYNTLEKVCVWNKKISSKRTLNKINCSNNA